MWTDGLTPLRILVRGLLLLLLVIGLLPTLACISPVGRAIKAGGVTLDEFMLKLWSGSLCRVLACACALPGNRRPARY
jgi:hypothetical protein